MPDTATTRPYGPDSPLAFLLEVAADACSPDESEQREDAETAAAHHTYAAYPQTLAQAVEAAHWLGSPAMDRGGRRFEPSAVAWLDGGLWLHHTLRITERDGAADVLTLVVPCTCGRYTDITLDGEEMLLELLAELAPTHGRSVHDDSAADCRSIPVVPPPDGPRQRAAQWPPRRLGADIATARRSPPSSSPSRGASPPPSMPDLRHHPDHT
ncbi:hypothetical protein [Streptomyces sp. NPDC005859]|uniref:hypothetical protein n=1 Tax=Streptomyces sp. NPDC005859 TaxID=3157170 RepID=UPI0033F34E3B